MIKFVEIVRFWFCFLCVSV